MESKVNNAPFDSGQVLNRRYQILSAYHPVETSPVVGDIDQESPGVLDRGWIFEADDLLRCWSCGTLQASSDDHYCPECGAELSKKIRVRLVVRELSQSRDEMDISISGVEPYDRFMIAGYEVWVEDQADLSPVFVSSKSPHPESYPAKRYAVQIEAGFRTDSGKVRSNNEDSLLALSLTGICEGWSAPALGCFAVADGMGGHAAGEVASRIAVHTLAQEVLLRIFQPEMNQYDGSGEDRAGQNPAGAMESLSARWLESLQAANRAVVEARNRLATGEEMGCTLTAALVRENLALVANAGDSRTYLLHEARLRKITRDHSVVASLIEQGMIGEDEVHAHVQKGIIYRSLGGELDATYDLFTLEVDPSDRLLLCSDGLWEMVPDSLIEDVLLERYEARDACNRLVELANLAGGEDNISVIVVNIGELPNT